MTKLDPQKIESDSSGCCSPGGNLTGLSLIGEHKQSDLLIKARIQTSVGEIPVVDTELKFSDRVGIWKARWGIGRMRFRVTPGLYAVGNPTDKSPVFVSANYKMSFDFLRKSLSGIDSWIMVIDTRGINVWCAAGKGTFGTDEIISRIALSGLDKVVSHRRIILPQLGAPGVSAYQVKEKSGFRVIYGPIRSADIPAFMQAGLKASPEMRRVYFTLRDRIVLVPNDLVASFKYPLLAAIFLFILSGVGQGIFSLNRMLERGPFYAGMIIIIYIIANILPVILLPFLPGKSFSAKGAWAGFLAALMSGLYAWNHPGIFGNWPTAAAWFLICLAVCSFVSMNFTGSSTYTSLSGVLKEMRLAVPIQIGTAAIGLILLVTGILI